MESTKQRWFILSAKYGLVDPNCKINPYDRSMNSMPMKERKEWAEDVSKKLRLHNTDIDTIYILAGQRYREFLTLWDRLFNHRGSSIGLGNHRGSIFRLLVGISLANRNDLLLPTSWGDKKARRKKMSQKELNAEYELEKRVSDYICAMPFVYLNVSSDSGRNRNRAFIERNAIALLSNCRESVINQSSLTWLGRHCDREPVRCSGLWNQNHVKEQYDASFLDVMENWVIKTEPV